MMIVALLLRPWIIMVTTPGILFPRILADDVVLIGKWRHHLEHLVRAFEDTRQYIQDMGRRIPAKNPSSSLTIPSAGSGSRLTTGRK